MSVRQPPSHLTPSREPLQPRPPLRRSMRWQVRRSRSRKWGALALSRVLRTLLGARNCCDIPPCYSILLQPVPVPALSSHFSRLPVPLLTRSSHFPLQPVPLPALSLHHTFLLQSAPLPVLSLRKFSRLLASARRQPFGVCVVGSAAIIHAVALNTRSPKLLIHLFATVGFEHPGAAYRSASGAVRGSLRDLVAVGSRHGPDSGPSLSDRFAGAKQKSTSLLRTSRRRC
mmetsp:Transcript_40095/g.110369  ORF Transcript_40095/g.110369 Transcript_40095/m.110369 type:complete len:229 (+) Transcript_40095:420-1106(+)